MNSGKALGMSSLIGIMMLVGIAASYSTFEQLRPTRRSAT
ncbi:hypothetical protein X734_32260 [Mesorhizobium sp. L2C084A000]|nr:hypothetical protein X734_32260 [Mesorhizobium sp. L2C084A000]